MIKTITKKIFVCDMCGYEYTGSKEYLVPKDVFEFTVNLADGAKNVQLCKSCQTKLKDALYQHLTRNIGYRIDQEIKKVSFERSDEND